MTTEVKLTIEQLYGVIVQCDRVKEAARECLKQRLLELQPKTEADKNGQDEDGSGA
jgi:hypothetical protein